MFEAIKQNTTLIKIISVVLLLLVSCLLVILGKPKKGKISIRDLAVTAIFSALSFVLYFIKAPFPFFSFLEFQFSSIPCFIIGFLLGPFYGALSICIRTLIKIPLTTSFCVGEIADFIIGILTVVSASIIYNHNKTKKNARNSLIVSCFMWIITSCILNVVFLLPAYTYLFFDGSVDTFIEAFNLLDTFKNLTTEKFLIYYLFIGVIPFNVLISTVNSLITFLIYKRISIFYHRKDKENN